MHWKAIAMDDATKFDNEAWDKAKAELGENAPVSDIAKRAQEIKAELQRKGDRNGIQRTGTKTT